MQMVTPLNQLFHCRQGVTTVWELFRAVMRNTINEDLAQAGYAAVLESFEVSNGKKVHQSAARNRAGSLREVLGIEQRDSRQNSQTHELLQTAAWTL